MMSSLLRIEMIILALAIGAVIVRTVNSGKLRVQYSLIWILIVFALLGAAFFPGVIVWLCSVIDVEKPSNLVYLCGIVVLLLITFYQTIIISKQSDQIKRLTQIVSIEKYLLEEKNEIIP